MTPAGLLDLDREREVLPARRQPIDGQGEAVRRRSPRPEPPPTGPNLGVPGPEGSGSPPPPRPPPASPASSIGAARHLEPARPRGSSLGSSAGSLGNLKPAGRLRRKPGGAWAEDVAAIDEKPRAAQGGDQGGADAGEAGSIRRCQIIGITVPSLGTRPRPTISPGPRAWIGPARPFEAVNTRTARVSGEGQFIARPGSGIDGLAVPEPSRDRPGSAGGPRSPALARRWTAGTHRARSGGSSPRWRGSPARLVHSLGIGRDGRTVPSDPSA